VSGLPKLLLLGDSIRGSYQAIVAKLLAGQAEVVAPAENGQFALYTLAALGRWLEQLGTPDVVHWNNGLHDVGHNPGRCPAQTPLADYVGNLRHILAALRATGATVVWATTTPVHPDTPFHTDRWGWRNEEIDAYNRAAAELMRAENVPVNDLHAVVAADPDRYISDDQIHLTGLGQRKCAEAVAAAVRPYLLT
jgi:lysophospholipase L1-like esterase